MKEFFNLIRWKNLSIVVLTMILMRYGIIEPLIGKINVILVTGDGSESAMQLQSPWYLFVLLVAATVFITAGGYVINDYFDIKTDLINKKGKVIVGTRIPRRTAMMWHNIFNISGVIIGFFISWKAGYVWLGAFFLLVSGLLYFYSASYKRQFLIGNIIVALLTAMVPLLVVVYEWPALYRYYTINAITLPDINLILYWVGGFALFAFLTTLVREIIKDIEDFEGDIAYGRNTVPVVVGVSSAKVIAVSIILITVVLLYLTWYFYVRDIITITYISLTVVLPLLFVIYKLIRSKEKKELHTASNMIKAIMMTGILYSLVVKIILTWNLY